VNELLKELPGKVLAGGRQEAAPSVMTSRTEQPVWIQLVKALLICERAGSVVRCPPFPGHFEAKVAKLSG